MSIVLQRVIKTPKIEVNEQNAGYLMKLDELIKLAGVSVFQANPDGSMAVDYTPHLCIINDGRRSDEVGLVVGETVVKLGIKYGNANQYQDLQMGVTVVVKEAPKVETLPFTLEEEFSLPVIQDQKTIEFKKIVDEDGHYVFVGQTLYGETGQALVDHFVLRQNLIDLIPEDLWDSLDGIEKANLKVNAVDVNGVVMEQFQLIRSQDDFTIDNEGFMTWELRTPKPLPFTNKGFSKQGVLGLNYEISFVAKFKKKEVPQELDYWNSLMSASPASATEANAESAQEKQVNPYEGFEGFAQNFEVNNPQSNEQVMQPSQIPQIEEKKTVETPIAEGWQVTGFGPQPKQEPQHTVDFSDAVSGLSSIAPPNTEFEQSPYGGGIPPMVNPQPSNPTPNNFDGFERISGATMTYPDKLLDTQGHPNPLYDNTTPMTTSGSVMMTGGNSFGGTPVGFQQPQGQGQKNDLAYNLGNDTDIAQGLEDLNSESNSKKSKKKGVMGKVKKSFEKRSKSKKGLIIGGIASAFLVIGLGFAGVMYRNAGIAEMKDTKSQVEANLSTVDSILSDDEVSSSESVELQRLLNNNLELLENAKTSNYFANLERRSLVERSNKATDKAKELIQKQTGVTSQTSPAGTSTDRSQVKEPNQSSTNTSSQTNTTTQQGTTTP